MRIEKGKERVFGKYENLRGDDMSKTMLKKLKGGGRIAGSERRLRESEGKYRTLTESSLTGIFIHQDGKYVFVNDRFAAMHGYTAQELLGKEHLTLIYPDDREAVRQRVSKRAMGQAVPRRYEGRRLRKDGETIWCEMMVDRIEYRGKPAIMGNIVGITEHKRAEEGQDEG